MISGLDSIFSLTWLWPHYDTI